MDLFLTARCVAGEQPNDDGTGCDKCPLNSYKTKDADWRSNCTACEDETETVGEGATSAEMCISKY